MVVTIAQGLDANYPSGLQITAMGMAAVLNGRLDRNHKSPANTFLTLKATLDEGKKEETDTIEYDENSLTIVIKSKSGAEVAVKVMP